MKEIYVSPSTECLNVETTEMLAMSEIKADKDDYADNTKDALIKGRRGSWGNLWNSRPVAFHSITTRVTSSPGVVSASRGKYTGISFCRGMMRSSSWRHSSGRRHRP